MLVTTPGRKSEKSISFKIISDLHAASYTVQGGQPSVLTSCLIHWQFGVDPHSSNCYFNEAVTDGPHCEFAISVQEHAKLTWGDEELPCISLSMPGVSAMHKLRWVANMSLVTQSF